MKNLLRSPLGFLLALALLATGCQQGADTPTAESPAGDDTTTMNNSAPEASPAEESPDNAATDNASPSPANAPNGGGAAKTKGDYPQAFIDAFMQGCTGSGAPEAYCQCSIDKIQEEFTKEEFEELDRLAREQKEIPAADQAKLEGIVTACRQ